MSQATQVGPNGPGQMRLFLGCFIALVATAFGFIVRATILSDLREQFDLSNEQAGYIVGAGLYPFAISIILFSLIVDRIGYGTAMIFAFIGHATSALLTIYAETFNTLYWATFLFALSNGIVEAVINPVVATVYEKNKTHWLNILHAGWPGGLVLGGLLSIAIFMVRDAFPGTQIWRWQVGLVLIPTALYGLLLLGQKFPVQERVAAGVSYLDMLKEFGWGSAFIVSFLLIAGMWQVLVVTGIDRYLKGTRFEDNINLQYAAMAGLAVIPTIFFGIGVRSFGRPMFVFLLLVMVLLATTELGTDGWISDIMGHVLKGSEFFASSPKLGSVIGPLLLVYTSLIMFILRFFAGPIVHRISPLGLLAASAAIASGGLVFLGSAGTAVMTVFLAATLYGFGKTFFWPTTLGVVSEQFPKGGALLLNAVAGVGMLAVGTLGGPAIGSLQDNAFAQQIAAKDPDLAEKVMKHDKPGMFGRYSGLDTEKVEKAKLSQSEKDMIDQIVNQTKQSTLVKIAILPAIMFVCYLMLIIYFRAKGGYKAQSLTAGAHG